MDAVRVAAAEKPGHHRELGHEAVMLGEAGIEHRAQDRIETAEQAVLSLSTAAAAALEAEGRRGRQRDRYLERPGAQGGDEDRAMVAIARRRNGRDRTGKRR